MELTPTDGDISNREELVPEAKRPKRTSGLPVKPVPVIVSKLEPATQDGAMLVIVGKISGAGVPVFVLSVRGGIMTVGVVETGVVGTRYTKPGRVAIPVVLITVTLPVAPTPSVATMSESERTRKDAAGVALVAEPNCTLVAPVKPRPMMLISVPDVPCVGVKVKIVGGTGVVLGTVSVAVVAGERKTKRSREAVPSGVVIFTAPVAPVLRVAIISESDTIVNSRVATPPTVKRETPQAKRTPRMETICPMVPVVGVKDVIRGANEISLILTGRLFV